MQINNKEKTPRILIINAIPIGYNNSTGITLKNIFSKWPKNEIMQLTLCNEDTRVSEGNPKYLLFNPRQIIIVYLLKKLFLNKNSSMSNVKDPGVVKKDIISVIKSFFNAFVDDSYILMFPDTIKAIRRFNPDIIYSNLASLRVMKVVLKISKLLQIPIVPHFMDDWPSTIYKAKSTYWAYYKSQRLLTKIIYNMKNA